MDSRKPLIYKEICYHCHGSGIVEADGYSCPTCGGSGEVPAYMEEERPGVPVLTPPPDAAVREAASRLDRSLGYGRYAHVTAEDINTLLSYVRAVQAPRLTTEQVEAVKMAEAGLRARGLNKHAHMLRTAFPEAFDGEVGRG